MSQPDNPAALLLKILKEIRTHPNEGDRLELVLEKVLEVPHGETSLLLSRVGKFYDLPVRVRSAVTKVSEVDAALYLAHFPPIETSFQKLNLKSRLADFRDPITEASLFGLQHCSALLEKQHATTRLTDEQLAELKSKVDSLIEKVSSASIDEFLKRFLQDRLYEIAVALQECRFFGAEGLERRLEACFGTIVLRHQFWKDRAEEPIVSEFWGLLAKIADLTAVSGFLLVSGTKFPEFIEWISG